MRRSPILPVSLAVAAVALSASQGHTVAEPDKRSNHEVVAFPLFALKASDRTISSNNHVSHESHSSHVSGGHSSGHDSFLASACSQRHHPSSDCGSTHSYLSSIWGSVRLRPRPLRLRPGPVRLRSEPARQLQLAADWK